MALTWNRLTEMEPATPIRALSSLTRRDADAVRATARSAGGSHVVEEHDDYDGYLSLVLTPVGAGEAYLVSGTSHAVELAAIDGDRLAPIGRYASVGAAMAVLRDRLARGLWA